LVHLKFNISSTRVKLNGYLIGSLPPKNQHLVAYKKKYYILYFHFRINTNSDGSFPIHAICYSKPQDRQIWV